MSDGTRDRFDLLKIVGIVRKDTMRTNFINVWDMLKKVQGL